MQSKQTDSIIPMSPCGDFLGESCIANQKIRKLMSQHPGKLISISKDKVIATSESFEGLTEKIKQQNEVLAAFLGQKVFIEFY